MDSANSRPELARKDTFQRMLDLERMNKVNRMQASQYSVPQLLHTYTAPDRKSPSPSSSNRDFRSQSLPAADQAMTASALSISIPTPSSGHSNGSETSKKYVISQGGDLITQEEEEDSDHDSDASSICQSPGWDLAAAKKRKEEKKAKQKRRRDKEKAEKDAKAVHKQMAKLSKPPPGISPKKPSRISMAMDRSKTESALSTIKSMPPPVHTTQSKESPSARQRRGSIEAGIKNFISAKSGISVPWKTSQNPTAQEPTQQNREFVPSRTTSKSEKSGFIGGLKLRQSQAVATSETLRSLKTGAGDGDKGPSSTDIPLRTSNNVSNASISEPSRPISQESVRSSQQWDGIYSQAARMTRSPSDYGNDIHSRERNVKKDKKYPPSSRMFPWESEDSSSSRRESSTTSARTSINIGSPTSDIKDGRVQRPASRDRTFTGDSAASDQSRGRSTTYVGHQRSQSRERSLAGFKDEIDIQEDSKDAKRPGSSGRMFFGRSRESSRDPSTARPTARPRTRDSIDADIKNAIAADSFFNDEWLAPKLQLGDFTASPIDEKSSPGPAAKSGIRQSLHGFRGRKNGTKAASDTLPVEKQLDPKSTRATPSPTPSFVSAVETQAAPRPKISRPLTTSVIDTNAISSKEKQTADSYVPPTLTQDFATRPDTQSFPTTIRRVRSGSRDNSRASTPIMSVRNSSVLSHTATDSSEEYTVGGFSNITTPAISRPHSEKEYSRSVDELSRASIPKSKKRSSKDYRKIENGLNGNPVMTGALPFADDSSHRDSWARTAMPMDSSDGEDRLQTPTGKRSVSEMKTALEKRIASDGSPPRTSDGLANSSNLDRLSAAEPRRSISTPDLQQDLSFLPALKHQALTKPQKKSRGFLGRKSKHASVASISSATDDTEKEKSPTSLVRPSLSLLPGSTTTKSEGSSLTNSAPPAPSQYLQNARLSIGHPRSPKLPPHSGPNSEPVAKMFVVCCSCKYFHDMPSKIYECMAKPDNVVTDTKLGVSGVISTSVKCPWCGHGMSTSCCAGYAAVVYLREKFH